MSLKAIGGNEPIILRIHLTQSNSFQEIRFDRSLNGIKKLKLIQYKITGAVDTGTILFSLSGQSTVDTYSNDRNSSYFPLLFDRIPEQLVVLNKPIPITGKSHIFNSSHRIAIHLKKQDENIPLTFQSLDLIFIAKNHFEQSECYNLDV